MHTLDGFSDDDLRLRLRAAAARRPRLGAHSTTLPEDPVLLRRADALVARARELLSVPVLVRQQVGRRLLDVSREALRRLGTLSAAWLRTHDPVFLRRAEAELQAVCTFSDWNPSHYLDTAEMSLGVALAYDWLYEALSPEVREVTAKGLWELGLRTALDDGLGWVSTHNNWGQVCHGGMTAAALALADRHPEESFHVVRRAFQKMPLSMSEYEPDGVYPEGPTYWGYGTGFNVAFLVLVESALGTSYGLANQPGFAASAQFMLHATGPTGEYFNFADCGRGQRCNVELPWFSSRFGLALPDDSPEAEAFLRQPERFTKNRLSPLLLLFGAHDAVFAPAAKTMALDWHGRGGSEMAAFRSHWTRDAWYLAVKGGRPNVSHGHMDVGGFVLEAHGQRWAEEAGAENYNSLEKQGYNLWQGAQEGQRWGVFRYGVQSHNIPVIDEQRQRVGGVAAVEVRHAGEGSPEAVLDLTALYGTPVARHFVFRNRAGVTITDTFADLKPGTRVRWQMLTQAHVARDGAKLVLSRGGQTLCLVNDVQAPWEVAEAEALTNVWDTPLPGFRRVSFECVVPTDGRLAWTVQLA